MSVEISQLEDGDQLWVPVDELEPHPRNQEIYTNPEISDVLSEIEDHGFKEEHRLIVTPERRILSGHRRWRASKEADLDEVPVEVTEVEDDNEALLRLLLANKYRNKTAAEQVNEAEAWREYYKSEEKPELVSNQQIDDLVAEKVEISRGSITKGRKVKEIATGERKAPEKVREEAQKQWESMQSGSQSINGGYKQVQITEAERETVKKRTVSVQKTPIVREQDAVGFLDSIDDPDLVIADPPYSTDVDDVSEFAATWVPAMLNAIGESGRAFIFIGAYPDELHAYLKVLDVYEVIDRTQVLVWTYRNTLGQTPNDRYKLNWQAILFIQSDPPTEIDSPKTSEQWAVQDINSPDARNGERYHEWEKPGELIRRFIRHTTDEGDLVVDPFVGTGTTVLEASNLGRETMGCDDDLGMLEIAEERGCVLDGC